MTDFEILRKYQSTPEAQELIAIANDTERVEAMDDAELSLFINECAFLNANALVESGVNFNLNNQINFYDAIFFDLMMPDEEKLKHLKTCEDDSQKERILALEKAITDLGSNIA